MAERAEAGTDVSVRCTSLLEANAQIRRLAKADAGVVAKIYKVTGASVVELEPGGGTTTDAEDEWVGDFTDVVKNAPVPGSAPVTKQFVRTLYHLSCSMLKHVTTVLSGLGTTSVVYLCVWSELLLQP